ncbi:MAG: ATP-binding protein, partial [Gammaproteobacteria bacterium]|nr:ATP-binding protein [Gammaproteobacteria bacterium]
GKMEIELLDCDLRTTVEECIAKEDSRLKEKELSVEISTPDCDTLASFDIQKIIRVVINLLSNAIKFTPEGKKITIEFEDDIIALDQQGDGATCSAIRFSILDEGVGIPEDELELVFEKFSQSSITNTGAGGKGLGLPICKEIIEAHSGKIWAENNPEGGTIFRFVIPREAIVEKKPEMTLMDDYSSSKTA